jgi:hypothetical protein
MSSRSAAERLQDILNAIASIQTRTAESQKSVGAKHLASDWVK